MRISRRFAPMLCAALLLPLSVFAPSAAAQDEEGKPAAPQIPEDIARMIKDGMADALESKTLGGRNADEFHWLAQAYTTKGRKARTATDRKNAFEKADDKYRKWITTLEKPGGELAESVRLAEARIEYANMILAVRASPALDERELSAGKEGDLGALKKLLGIAREQYEKASEALGPLGETGASEEELLVAGLLDSVRGLKLDVKLNLGWTLYHRGRLEEKNRAERIELLRAAEKQFQELVDINPGGQVMFQCYLALGIAQRELDKPAESEKSLANAMDETAEAVVKAQARYELGRLHLRNEKFEEARAAWRPLAEKDLKSLSAEDRAARFYISVAKLWEANSYLLEAEAARKDAEKNPQARVAIQLRATRLREQGLTAMSQLRAQGGPWPALVRNFIAASVNVTADPRDLSPDELFATASLLLEAKDYVRAKDRLVEAAKRANLPERLAGDILFELGTAHYRMNEFRPAAEAFARLTKEQKGHERAQTAATYAYQLWAKISKETRKKEDYGRLAESLLHILQNFPDHPNRAEAMWWLPVALQSAGRYAEAQEQFANVPKENLNWEEAQYRRALCARLMLDVDRPAAPTPEFIAKADAAADGLLKYSNEAMERAQKTASKEEVMSFSGLARLAAAELYAMPGVEQFQKSLDIVKGFEEVYEAEALMGRLLAVRIRAYRGLKQFDEAGKIVQQYLQSVPPEKAGPVLAGLARGMQDEVQRLVDEEKMDLARRLAEESLGTFKMLEDWVSQDPKRSPNAEIVQGGRAEMLYMAGQYAEAQTVIARLLEKAPRNGIYQRLLARILTAQLGEGADAKTLEDAKAAWAALLTDPGLRKSAPDRYWEARYNWLNIHHKQGNSAEVARAIHQDNVWFPDLGGPAWRDRLTELYAAAAPAAGMPAELTQPPADTQPAETEETGEEKAGETAGEKTGETAAARASEAPVQP